MQEARLESFETPLENSKISMTVEQASEIVRNAAEPRPVGDSVKAAIRRAARRLGWDHSRTFSIWYADPRVRLHTEECDALRARSNNLQNHIAALEHKGLGDEGYREALEILKTAAEAIQALAARAGARLDGVGLHQAGEARDE